MPDMPDNSDNSDNAEASVLGFPAAPLDRQAADDIHDRFRTSTPVRHVAIDGFLDQGFADELAAGFPSADRMPKSRDYMFSDKRELSTLDTHSPTSRQLHDLFMSPEFAEFLQGFGGTYVVDELYVGGGFHVGGVGSFLDLHTDFNIHPVNPTWHRRLNILLYLNPGWQPEWGGQLILTSDPAVPGIEVEPLHNRLVVMESTDTSFHGYGTLSFPPDRFRQSVAAYAYEVIEDTNTVRRTTNWVPQTGGVTKRVLAKNWSRIVLTKNRFLGSGTLKNRR